MARDAAHIERLARRLYDGITGQLAGVVLNGDATARYWGNVNLSFAYVEGESLLMGLKVRRRRQRRCGGRRSGGGRG